MPEKKSTYRVEVFIRPYMRASTVIEAKTKDEALFYAGRQFEFHARTCKGDFDVNIVRQKGFREGAPRVWHVVRQQGEFVMIPASRYSKHLNTLPLFPARKEGTDATT